MRTFTELLGLRQFSRAEFRCPGRGTPPQGHHRHHDLANVAFHPREAKSGKCDAQLLPAVGIPVRSEPERGARLGSNRPHGIEIEKTSVFASQMEVPLVLSEVSNQRMRLEHHPHERGATALTPENEKAILALRPVPCARTAAAPKPRNPRPRHRVKCSVGRANDSDPLPRPRTASVTHRCTRQCTRHMH